MGLAENFDEFDKVVDYVKSTCWKLSIDKELFIKGVKNAVIKFRGTILVTGNNQGEYNSVGIQSPFKETKKINT